MYYIEIGLFVAGVLLLVFGYRKSSRNMLLGAAILLFLAGAFGDFVAGFAEGYHGARASRSDLVN